MVLRTALLLLGPLTLHLGSRYLVELYRRSTLAPDTKQALATLTPDEVIRRCGAPNVRRESDFLFGELFYERSGITIRFIRRVSGEGKWMFTSLRLKEHTAGTDPMRKDPRWLLESLPCLSPAGDVKAAN